MQEHSQSYWFLNYGFLKEGQKGKGESGLHKNSSSITWSTLQTPLHCSQHIKLFTPPRQQWSELWATCWPLSTASYQPCCCHSTSAWHLTTLITIACSASQRTFWFWWHGLGLAAFIPFGARAVCHSEWLPIFICQALNWYATGFGSQAAFNFYIHETGEWMI